MFLSVGMTGFEPATTRPPDAYSNRTELHPASDFVCLRLQRYDFFANLQAFLIKFLVKNKKKLLYHQEYLYELFLLRFAL